MTKKELVGGIKAFWSNAMTAAKCQRYIEHTHVVLPKIIDCEGEFQKSNIWNKCYCITFI